MANKKDEKTKVISKSAKTGKMVSKEFAVEHPDTTYETTVEAKGGAKWLPAIGEKFLLGDEIASVDADGVVTIHEIVSGCQSERISYAKLVNPQPLSKDEAFRRLA